jgi:hypothetical protein
MDKTIILLAILLLLGVSAFAQQDSLIVGSVEIDSGITHLFLPVYGVSFDSVDSYNFRLQVIAPDANVGLGQAVQYYPPLTSWDVLFDSVVTVPPSIYLIGDADNGGDPNPPVFTRGQRMNLWALLVQIESNAHPQIIEINSIGQAFFGNNTIFVPGYIYYGIPSGSEVNSLAPNQFSLSQNYPNPFNSSTEIQFSLASPGPASLVIYDIQGREVRLLLDGNLEAGSHSAIWNGLNDDSKPVSSGVYFYKLLAGDATQTNRMTLLR